MTNDKKMYKVLSPMGKKDGGTYWMRVGSAYTNRDSSLNVYLDAMPPPSPKSNRFELQIRELTEEDLRRRDSFSSHGGTGGGGTASASPQPYAAGAFNRDARAVTATTAAEPSDNVPF